MEWTPDGYPGGSSWGHSTARERGDGAERRKNGVDCAERDVRAIGILGDWEALSLQEDVWYNTVVEGGGDS